MSPVRNVLSSHHSRALKLYLTVLMLLTLAVYDSFKWKPSENSCVCDSVE